MIRFLVRSAMIALMPAHAGLPGIRDTDLDPFLDRIRRESSTLFWMGIVSGAFVYAAFPLFTIGVPLPAFLLPDKLQNRYAERVASHPLYLARQAIFLVKMGAGLCWGAHPSVRGQLGLEPYPADPGTWRSH